MNISSKAPLLTLAAMICAVSTRSTAWAADSCQPVFDAMIKVVTTPSHSYTTSTSAAVNGGKPTDGETIFTNGQKYIRARGKWMGIPVTTRDVLEQEKEKETHGKSNCQSLRAEPVNGEAAMLYSLHREFGGVTEDGQIWISKGMGLPLRVEEDVTRGGNKEHRITRFEYGNIRPPL